MEDLKPSTDWKYFTDHQKLATREFFDTDFKAGNIIKTKIIAAIPGLPHNSLFRIKTSSKQERLSSLKLSNKHPLSFQCLFKSSLPFSGFRFKLITENNNASFHYDLGYLSLINNEWRINPFVIINSAMDPSHRNNEDNLKPKYHFGTIVQAKLLLCRYVNVFL